MGSYVLVFWVNSHGPSIPSCMDYDIFLIVFWDSAQFLPLVLTADPPPPNFSSYFITMAHILPLNLRQGPSPPPLGLLNVEIPHWDYHIAQTYSYRLGFGIEILMDQSSGILQHSQNRPTRDRWLKLLHTLYDNPGYKIKFDKSKL